MGSNIGRIEKEFIIKALDDGKLEINMHGLRKQAKVVILNYEEEEYIDVFSKDRDLGEFQAGEKVRLFFSYFGHVMTFNSVIIDCNEEKAKITPPDNILKNLQRKYERVNPPSGVELKFTVDKVKVELKFPESETFERLGDYSAEDTFDTSSLNNLIGEFREIIKGHCDGSKIIMFRDKAPETMEEQLVAKSGRVFYIQSIYEGMSVPETEREIPVIEKEMLEIEEVETIISDMKKSGLYSVLYCPILYHEYTVGYIFLYNEKNKKILVDTLEYVYQFSKVLAWLLNKNDYFANGEARAKDFKSQIVDISASGLLFADESEILSDALNIYTDINLELSIDGKKMIIFSRIMRKYHSKSMTFYGVQFMEIEPEDFKYLFEFVYGRVFNENDSRLWEGGSRPPTLEF